MPEFVDEKTGKRIFHENDTTLKIQQNVEKKFEAKDSFMHRDFDDDQPYDAKRAVDEEGKPILVQKFLNYDLPITGNVHSLNIILI